METIEAKRLAAVEAAIEAVVGDSSDGPELRFQLLEAVAARLGGFDLESFQSRFEVAPVENPVSLLDQGREVVKCIDDTGIHPALCLSALARETLDATTRRAKGAYHTDFRLAQYLAQGTKAKLHPGVKVVDPACGAGILLTAVSIVACRSDRILASDWLRHSVYAADLSPMALRGTMLALSALTDDLDSLQAMRQKWRTQDSLLAPDEVWHSMARDGFDIVVANPPWEKVKLTRHEFIKAKGSDRHYGSSYSGDGLAGYESAKSQKARLAADLVSRYPSLARGEPDLYVAFTELVLRLTRVGGSGALIVPGGLIRSKNTEGLRRELVGSSKDLCFTVMANTARHFAIDTRFKFLVVNYVKAARRERKVRRIGMVHARADNDGVLAPRRTSLPLPALKELRPDLTLPEVRTASEWRLFERMQSRRVTGTSDPKLWQAAFCREVDMTRGRPHFVREALPGCLPLIEGRMVQPHRLGCKAYVSGEGRSARWRNLPPGRSTIQPQFWVRTNALSPSAHERVWRTRVGFCDITGQTNERSMMASIMPPGLACGNKVPTVEFPNDRSEERLLLWLAVVNSLPFDWLIRRVVTTTVNYFVLSSIRLPMLEVGSLPAQRLIKVSRRLADLDTSGVDTLKRCWRIARLRAEADAIVANAYGCGEDDLQLMIDDFPLLDRGQPRLPDASKSTVTADLLVSTWRRHKRCGGGDALRRLREAEKLGAIPYLSSEFARSTQGGVSKADVGG